MTIKMMLFVFIVSVWALTGLIGMSQAKSSKNWWIIFFVLFAFTVPLIAKYCGL